MAKKKSDFDKGVEDLKKRKDAKDAGYDATHPNRLDFEAGWRAGRKVSDPDDTTPMKDVKKKVKKEYGSRRKDSPERAGYRAGYAHGSDRSGS